MAFDLALIYSERVSLLNRQVPIRFARAISGFSHRDAPDVDDHGFTSADRYCDARGPVVGICKGKTIRIRVVRDRLEPTSPLFVTSDDETISTIEHPTPGTALNPNDIAATDSTPERKGDCIYINGASTSRNTQATRVRVRYGASDGPVLAEIEVRVMPILVINVQAHSVSVNGGAQALGSIQPVRRLIRRVNHVYAQAGIYFRLRPNLMSERVTGFATANAITLTNTADSLNTELQTVLNQNPARRDLNAYFVPNYFDNVRPAGSQWNQTLGIAFSQIQANANPPNAASGFPGCQPGITMWFGPDMKQLAHTTAHEIGHCLTLEHYAMGNGASIRHDLWAHRCLMHNFVNLRTSSTTDVVGYGAYADGSRSAGQLIMTKRRRRIPQSDQVARVRRAALRGTYRPVR